MVRSRRRRGFTLIELVVVILIVAIIIALIVPAIQRVRETAIRVQCLTNLKQIGFSLLGYHDRDKRFPPGYTSKVDAKGLDLGPGWGWLAHTLPFLEQKALYEKIPFGTNVPDASVDEVRQFAIPTSLCPADDAPLRFTFKSTNIAFARANYLGNFGSLAIGDDPGKGNGVFYRNSVTRLKDLTDGTSTTMLAGERHAQLFSSTWVGSVAGDLEGPVLVLGSALHPPNGADAHEEDFGSRHARVTHVVFADGSARPITSEIKLLVWHALATRAGNEADPPGP